MPKITILPEEFGPPPSSELLATRDSGYSSGGPDSRLACCHSNARVRPQQRGCGAHSSALRPFQRSPTTLQQRGGAWGRQAGP